MKGIDGNKTYGLVVLFIGYLAYCVISSEPMDTRIVTGAGALIAASLRHAIAKGN